MIINFVVHFNTTGNATLLTKADDVLKQSLNQSNNGSSFAGFDVDRNQTFLEGKRVGECFINGWVVAVIILYKQSQVRQAEGRLRVVPIFLRDSRASETRARVKITPREKRRLAAGRQKNEGLQTKPKLLN